MTDKFILEKLSGEHSNTLEPKIERKQISTKTGLEALVYAIKDGFSYCLTRHFYNSEDHKNNDQYLWGYFEGVQDYGRINLADNESVIDKSGEHFLILKSPIGSKPIEVDYTQRLYNGRKWEDSGLDSLYYEYLEYLDMEEKHIEFVDFIKVKK